MFAHTHTRLLRRMAPHARISSKQKIPFSGYSYFLEKLTQSMRIQNIRTQRTHTRFVLRASHTIFFLVCIRYTYEWHTPYTVYKYIGVSFHGFVNLKILYLF